METQSIPASANFWFRNLSLTFELNDYYLLTLNEENLKHLGLFNVKLKKKKKGNLQWRCKYVGVEEISTSYVLLHLIVKQH